MLADFFLTQMDKTNPSHGLDRLKIYEHLMYHDLVEIESSDTPLHPEMSSVGKEEREQKAFKLLKEEIPLSLKEKYISLFHEYEERKTLDAKFAKVIDALDAVMHELDYKKD